jgi:hypothetical protein
LGRDESYLEELVWARELFLDHTKSFVGSRSFRIDPITYLGFFRPYDGNKGYFRRRKVVPFYEQATTFVT